VVMWYRCNNIDEMQGFYKSVLPRIRRAARNCGYAIGVHGSLRRDLDLIAVPWVDQYESPDMLAKAVQIAASGGIHASSFYWEQKPCGRIATSLAVCWINWPDAADGTGHIDLSVIVPTDNSVARR